MCVAGDLVGADDIESSPTFELIVEGGDAEEVELESRSATTMTSSAAEAAVLSTAFVNKRLKMSDADDIDIVSASECSSNAAFVTGVSAVMYIFLPNQ